MKKSKILLFMLFIVAVVVSCNKNDQENITQLITPTGNSTFITTNNGGNVTCEEVALATGCEFDYTSGKIDYYDGDGGIIVLEDGINTLTWETDGTYVTWTSTIGINVAVIVKGGPNAKVYFSGCDDCKQTSGNVPLSAPMDPIKKRPYGLSNITFCYNLCEPDEEEPELLVALKCYTTDGGWCVAADAASQSNAYRMGIFNYIFDVKNTFNLYAGGYVPGTLVGTMEITNNEDYLYVKIVATSPIITKSFLYIGTTAPDPNLYKSFPYRLPVGDETVLFIPAVATVNYTIPLTAF